MQFHILGILFPILMFGAISGIIYLKYKKSEVEEYYKYKTFWPRFWAPAIDGFVLLPIGLIIQFINLQVGISFVLIGILSIFENLITFLYSIILHGKYGKTVGKSVCKVEVLDNKTEEPISYKQAILRDCLPIATTLIGIVPLFWNLGFIDFSTTNIDQLEFKQIGGVGYSIAASIVFIWYAAEILTMLTNSKRRSLHDLIAGTVVVRTNTYSI